jgi:hypothetical protein
MIEESQSDKFDHIFTSFPGRTSGAKAQPASRPKAKGKPVGKVQPQTNKPGKGEFFGGAKGGQTPQTSSISRIFLVPVNNCPATRGVELTDFLFFNIFAKISVDDFL